MYFDYLFTLHTIPSININCQIKKVADGVAVSDTLSTSGLSFSSLPAAPQHTGLYASYHDYEVVSPILLSDCNSLI